MDIKNSNQSHRLPWPSLQIVLGLLTTLNMGYFLPSVWAQVPGPSPAHQWIAQDSSPNNARGFIRQGDSYFAEENYEGAIQAYTKSIQLVSSNPYAYYNRANAYRKLGQHKEAIFDYTRSIRINPANDFAYLYRGICLLAVDQPKAAAANFTELIKRDEQNAAAYHYRGDANLKLEQRDAAIEDYRKASELYKSQRKGNEHRLMEEQLRGLLPPE